MQRGLDAFGGDDADVDIAVHHAGVALEHLLKAFLVAQHPALVVDGRHLDSLLHAVGLGAQAKTPLSRVRTIGLEQAYERCRLLLKQKLVADEKQFVVVAEGRNGVAHLGIHERSEAEAALAMCFRVADIVLEALSEDPAAYWGGYKELHDQLQSASATRVRVLNEAKTAAAQKAFKSRFGGLDAEGWTVVQKALIAVDPFPTSDTEPATCPACGQQGWLAGDKRVEYQYDQDGGGAVVVLDADAFECPFCRLELDVVELELAGTGVVVETDYDV
ncbi:MAG TPA: hypothetical protein VFR67_28755, partial [Pilimelia sp.]|nr:hypothetical protein [Pilimelia sp.]